METGEKVVANRLQIAGLFHEGQFGSVKGRSAIEAVLVSGNKAQKCLGNEGAAAWGFWDVKGRFQNVREEEVIAELEKSKEGRKWIPYVRDF